MTEEVGFDLDAAHMHFAKSTNGRTWELLSKADRSASEDFEMEYTANASLYHWSQAGSELHLQRGEWLMAHVYTVLGLGNAALRHAVRCYELTQAHSGLMQDFDFAYAHEAMARAMALEGNTTEALAHYEKARDASLAIKDEEDREIFMADFVGGEWYGIP